MNTLEDINRRQASSKWYPWMRVLLLILGVLITGWILLRPLMLSRAAPVFTFVPITWNVVGLDSGNVNVGPNTFPVAARLCNTGDTAATNIVTIFEWDNNNPYINLSGSERQDLPSLGVGSCHDFYFSIVISRNAAAYTTARRFHITATDELGTTISTPLNREIYVQPLDASSNLAVTSISGPTSVNVGDTYQYVVRSSTAPNNYEQLEHFINFPDTIFQLTRVDAVYSVPPGATNDKEYADACGWQNDPSIIGTYLTCVGPNNYPGGTVGGTVVTTYTVEVVSQGTATLFSTVYGYSAVDYRYNSDIGEDSITVVASPGGPSENATPTATATATLTGTPHTPTATATTTLTGTPYTATPTRTGTAATPTLTGTITPNPGATKVVTPSQAGIGERVTFTIRVTNNGSAPATSVRLDDTFESYPYLDIYDLTTTKGTKNITGRRATVNIGTLNPGEVVVVTIVIRVNSTAVGTPSPCNIAVIKYSVGGSKNSNSQCFKVLGGPGLPGTGELPIESDRPGTPWDLVLLCILTAFIGGLLLVIGLVSKTNRKSANLALVITGLILIGASLLTGITALNLGGEGSNAGQVSIALGTETASDLLAPASASPTINPLAVLPAYLLATPRAFPTVVGTLPSYPIPSPTLVKTPQPGESGPDTSAVVRIVIPTLGVDAEVAYVPFDGHSWWIQGLREEVAWLGNTSWPGLEVNTALAGHVTVAGLGDGPFRYLSDLVQNDEIRLYTENNVYTYRVRERLVVEETEMWVTEPTENPQITLITCVEWSEKLQIYMKRLVVIADQVEIKPHAY